MTLRRRAEQIVQRHQRPAGQTPRPTDAVRSELSPERDQEAKDWNDHIGMYTRVAEIVGETDRDMRALRESRSGATVYTRSHEPSRSRRGVHVVVGPKEAVKTPNPNPPDGFAWPSEDAQMFYAAGFTAPGRRVGEAWRDARGITAHEITHAVDPVVATDDDERKHIAGGDDNDEYVQLPTERRADEGAIVASMAASYQSYKERGGRLKFDEFAREWLAQDAGNPGTRRFAWESGQRDRYLSYRRLISLAAHAAGRAGFASPDELRPKPRKHIRMYDNQPAVEKDPTEWHEMSLRRRAEALVGC